MSSLKRKQQRMSHSPNDRMSHSPHSLHSLHDTTTICEAEEESVLMLKGPEDDRSNGAT